MLFRNGAAISVTVAIHFKVLALLLLKCMNYAELPAVCDLLPDALVI